MKKRLIVTVVSVCAVTLGVVFSQSQESEVDLTKLKYGRVSAYSFVQADVHQKSDNKRVIWFQLFDRKDDKSTVDGYKASYVKQLGKYPAKIAANMHIWMLVGNRFEIRLMGDRESQEYRNTGKLAGFIMKFDLTGMEEYSGPPISGKELVKYCPKLGN
ncbi:MAG: hypothetical protein JXA20_13760 [Spirochaetes bacterium]|nr:hypothetical protein [Spirochaetota bacterium]